MPLPGGVKDLGKEINTLQLLTSKVNELCKHHEYNGARNLVYNFSGNNHPSVESILISQIDKHEQRYLENNNSL